MRRRLPPGGRWLAALCALLMAAASAAQTPPAGASIFDDLFGSEKPDGKSGQAADGLALPGLFAGGRRLADAVPLHDLGPGQGACVVAAALLDALELDHQPEGGGIALTLPEPRRRIAIPAAALLPSPSGPCLPLAGLPRLLPISLAHDPVSQRLLLEAAAPLPVLMRLDRAERQARLHPETLRPAFPLAPAPAGGTRLWSLDLAATMGLDGEAVLATQASGEILGLAARASLSLARRAAPALGFTLAEARDTPDLLGPLHARSVALGDVASPAQPLIADALSGRGLVIASRPPWRADLVDEIELSGPLPPGWEAELWHEDQLIAATRTPDASGQWRFAKLPVRIGENRWRVRLYGPHGETSEQAFTRLVGTEMNAENEVDYAIGFIDGGRPLWGPAPVRGTSGAAGFASIGWGVTPEVTARFGLNAPLAGDPGLSLGLNGGHAGTLWAATVARDGLGGIGGALRLARRLGGTDLLFDAARHGRDAGPQQSPLVRELAARASLSAQGRLAFGRLSLPWQLRAATATRRGGGQQQDVAARIAVPLAGLQGSASLGLTRQGGTNWQGSTSLGLAGRAGAWRVRGGIDATLAQGWRLAGFGLSAARTAGANSVTLDLGWQAQRRRIAAGVAFNRRLGNFGLSAGIARSGEGWRATIGLTVGLWQNRGRWHGAPAGLSRGGAIVPDLFIDTDGDGTRDPGETPVAGGRFIVGNALRGETTGSNGQTLLRGLPTGRSIDIETQLASLSDFTLRPARAGERLSLRPGEVRALAIPLHITGSIDAQVLLASANETTPRAGIEVSLLTPDHKPIATARSDFEGHVLFDSLKPGTYLIQAGDQPATSLTLTPTHLDQQTRLLLPPLG